MQRPCRHLLLARFITTMPTTGQHGMVMADTICDNNKVSWRTDSTYRLPYTTHRQDFTSDIFIADSMGLASVNMVQLAAKAAVLCEIITAIGPLKVTQCGTNRKPVCDFLLVTNSNLCCILHCFQAIRTYCWNYRFLSFLLSSLIQGELLNCVLQN